ncbi:MAG: SMI1/KNR4 family protein [Adlercreutzia sp.]|nr:SMI1/KNR4 family protein [Adlercreutzia sp.]
MQKDTLDGILKYLNSTGKMSYIEGATTGQIEEFEVAHDITLPKDYKVWLQFSDGGECYLPAGAQFYGVAHKPIIDTGDGSRPNEDYIVIGALATGDPILCQKNGDEISIYNQEEDRIEDDERYRNFFLFLMDLRCIVGAE